ncbi:hypothetical protein TGCAST_222075B, partial [Toxoplasma gondii CAST]
LYVSRLDREL